MSRPTPCHSMSWHCIIIRLIPCPRQHEALMTINASTNKVYHQNMSADATRRKSCGHLTKRRVLFTIITIPNVSNFKNENDCIIEHYYPSLHRVSDHHSRHQPTHARTFTHTHTPHTQQCAQTHLFANFTDRTDLSRHTACSIIPYTMGEISPQSIILYDSRNPGRKIPQR